jgi:hypothetical protein
MISDIKMPDSNIVREAEELARSTSSLMLFNHVMRCYWFSELFAQRENSKADREQIFLSSVLHDLGFTEAGRGPNRFEIEGAHAARKFLLGRGVSDQRAWEVWTTIALHTWDMNLFKQDDARLTEMGILYDVVGVPGAKLDPADVAEIVRRYPRLGFKHGFYEMLREDSKKEGYPHFFHICTCIAAHEPCSVVIPDARERINAAPFDE